MATVKVEFKVIPDSKLLELHINDRYSKHISIYDVLKLLDKEQNACFEAGQLVFFLELVKVNQI